MSHEPDLSGAIQDDPVTDPRWQAMSLPGIGADTTVVVLGGGGAIGGEIVRAFAAMGATVALVTRSFEQARQLAAEVGGPGKVVPFAADITDGDALDRLAADVTSACGVATVLVNSAAVGGHHKDVADIGTDAVRGLLDVNAVGALQAVQAFLPGMRERGHGRVISIGSVAADRVMPGGVAYGVSKAALISLTRHLAVALGPDGITVNAVSPGQTPTRIRGWDEPAGAAPVPKVSAAGPSGPSSDSVPVRRRGELADFVGVVLFLASDLAGYITGANIPVDGGTSLVRAATY
jgi:NAD(P)-dependent dehydrogenase (short-subunit alcohol dehydrogenase family)